MKAKILLAVTVFLIYPAIFTSCIPAKISISKSGKIVLQLDSKRNYSIHTDSSDSEIYLTDLKGSFIDRLTANDYYDGWPEFSHDENFLVYVSHPERKWQIRLLNLKSREDKIIYEDTREIHNPVFSPNDEFISFFTKSGNGTFVLEVFSLSLNKKISHIENVIPYSITWSADNRYVFIVKGLLCDNTQDLIGGYIGTYDIIEKKEKEKVTAGFFRKENLIFHTNINTNELCFSAIAQDLPLDLGNINSKYRQSVFLINNSGTNLRRISTNDDSAGFATFSPDGKKIMWLETKKGAVSILGNICIYDTKKKYRETVLENGKYTYPQWVHENLILLVDLQYNIPHLIVYDLIEKKRTDITWKMSETTETTPEE